MKLVTKGSEIAAKAAARGEIASQAEANRLVIPAEVSGLDPERVLVLHYPHKWKPYDLADIDYLSAVRKGTGNSSTGCRPANWNFTTCRPIWASSATSLPNIPKR